MIYPRQQPWRGPHADWNVVEQRLSQRLLHALQIGLEQVRPKHAYLTASRLAAARLNASLQYSFKIRLHETFCENCRYLCTCTSCMRQSAQLTACFAIGCSITSNPFRNCRSIPDSMKNCLDARTWFYPESQILQSNTSNH